jgi:class 3 adenylate cyclase/CHASE2 domain-containing sensor protein
MLKPLQSLRPFLDLVLANRYFQFAFWTFATCLIAIIASLLLARQGTVTSMELSLLDLKTRFHASYFPGPETTPSKDIVLLGIDGNTDKYIRLHPESGLSLTIQRDKLAKILNYLTDQGVRAVIFDLEFKDPKQGDAELVEAIRRNGHVYAADRMDYTLGPFINDQLQSIAEQREQNPRYFTELFIYEGVLRPYMTFLSETRNRWMPWKSVSLLDIGVGPVYHPFRVIEPSLMQLGNSLTFNHARYEPFRAKSLVSTIPIMEQSDYTDLLERTYSKLCTENSYTRYYQNNQGFLNLLEQKGLDINLDHPIPASVDRNITHCYTFPTVTSIMDALASIGIPSIDYYDDAYIRSATTLYRGYKGNFYTYLGIRPVIDLLNINSIFYAPGSLTLGKRRIPLMNGDKVMINWRSPRFLVEEIFKEHKLNPETDPGLMADLETVSAEHNNPMLGGGHIYRQVSIIDVLRTINHEKLLPDEAGRLYNIPHRPKSGPFSFKNKIVIVGNTVTDIHRTPMSNTMFGPEVVAAVLDMMLHDHIFIQPPPPAVQWILVGVIAIAIAAIAITFENLAIAFSVGIMLVTLYWLLNLMAFVYWGYWLDLVMPSLVLGLALISATLYRYYIHDQEKHHLTNVFSKYVSPQIMTEIMKNPEKALDNLKGGKKILTVLFADLQGFTHQFENADPEVMVSQLNEYFDVMTEIVLNHGGTYDKYMGDSIMAFFGAPAEMPNHAEMACRAAMEMQKALMQLNERWGQGGERTLSHGIGISSGEMFVGNFGSKNIKNFTVMGSNVNLGSRLEAYTRIAHWPVIISEQTWALSGDTVRVIDLGRIQVKGMSKDVQIYGLEAVLIANPETTPDDTTPAAALPASASQ